MKKRWSKRQRRRACGGLKIHVLMWASMAGVLMGSSPVMAQGRIEKKAAEFSATRGLGEEPLKRAREKGVLTGYGEAEYAFEIPHAGWYELYVAAAAWATELHLDGEFLIYTPFASGVWEPKEKAEKVMNIFLEQGAHTLKFSRPWHPGLPYLSRFFLQPAADLTGKVRLIPQKDCLAFRMGESAPVRLWAGKSAEPATLSFTLTDVQSGAGPRSFQRQIPAGEGVHEETVALPTDREGVFDLKVTDAQGRAVDRVVQYLVVDTQRRPETPAPLRKELVETIDCATRKPDYEYGETRVVTAAFGSYRESGPKGVLQYHDSADSFAYILHLPSTQEFYLAEVDCPDDDLRCFAIYYLETGGMGFAPAPGIASGGPYPLSQKLQTRQLFFVPRDQQPRLIFRPWQTNQRAAVSRIRIYRVGPALPDLRHGDTDRRFGLCSEESLRIPHYFGSLRTGNNWLTICQAAERKAEWSNFIGATHWVQSIAIYQAMLWPSRVAFGLSMGDETAGLGEVTRKEPLKKDTIRLMLLTCEKHGLGFVGEIHMPLSGDHSLELDRRLGGKGDFSDDGPQKPWLIVSKDGKAGERSPHRPYYNPLHPGVQDFIAALFQELADRYKDSPAFKGLAIRLMGWCFTSWQTFPSIAWGYGDYEIGLFEQETGVKVPVAVDDPQRFGKRYDWLMANAYEKWVDWRCRKIHQYWTRLAGILTKARPDLPPYGRASPAGGKLYVEAFGPIYDSDETGVGAMPVKRILLNDQKGWLRIARESGIDPSLYRDAPHIVLSDGRHYPAGFVVHGEHAGYRAAADRDFTFDPAPVAGVAKPAGGGSVSACFLGQYSWEEYPETAKYGVTDYGQYSSGAPGRFPVSASIAPPGRHFLELYASMMADGNVVESYDFTRETLMDQAEERREFMAEYRSLPRVGMQRLPGADDPVALWWGKDGRAVCFYLVNRASYPVDARVRFQGKAQVRRLATASALPAEKDGSLAVTLQPYQLLACVNDAGEPPVALAASAPEAVKQELGTQIAFAQKLLAGEGAAAGVTLVPFSAVDQKRAEEKLSEARRASAEGRTVAARRALLHHHLVKVYEAFSAWPPNLWHRKAPPRPEGALSPQELLEKADRANAAVIPASQVAASLTGEHVLTWEGAPLSFAIASPLANRYRLRFAYLTGAAYARPDFLIDGQRAPGQDRPGTENALWGERSLPSLVSLGKGPHRLTACPTTGKRAGLFFIAVEPAHRNLVAKDWRVIGPFPSAPVHGKPGTGLETVFPPEQSRDFAARYPGDAGLTLSWQQPQDAGDYVDLHKLTGAFAMRVSYAVTHIDSPEERPAELKFGVDYWARLWLNGERLFEVTTGHGFPVRDRFTIPLTLKKGRNELLVKVHAGSAGNGFWLSISDPGDLSIRAPIL